MFFWVFLLEEGEPEYGVRGFFRDSSLTKIFFSTVFSSSGFGIIFIILPFYIYAVIDRKDVTFYGLILTLTYVLSVLLILPSGIFADRFSRILLIRVGSVSSSIGGFLLYFASNWQGLLVGSLLLYSSYPLFTPSLSAIIADRTTGYGKDLAYSIFYGTNLAFFAVGNVMLYAFQLMNIEFDLEGLRFTVLIFALFNLIAGVIAFTIKHKRVPNRNKVKDSSDEDVFEGESDSGKIDNSSSDAKGGVFGFLGRNMAWRPVLINLILGLGAGFMVPFFMLFFEDRFSVEIGTIGLIFAVQQVFMALGNFVAPLISRSIRRIPTMALTEIAAIICAIYLAFTQNLTLAIIAFIARGALMNVANPLIQSLMMDLVGEEYRGTASANIALAFSVGNIPSPYISSIIINSQKDFAPSLLIYTPSLLIMSAIYSIAVMVVASLNRVDKEAMKKHLPAKAIPPPEMI